MDTGHFLKLCVEKGISILPSNNVDLDQYKKLTEHFNYPCAFNEEGVCRECRDSKCCCINCAFDVGYLKKIRDSVNRVDEYASKFDKSYGFWRHGIGCILPRELRSTTCTAFVCNTARSSFKYMNNGTIAEFMKILYFYDDLSPKEKEDLNKLYIKIKNTL